MHVVQGNWLTNGAMRMKTTASISDIIGETQENQRLNEATMQAYKKQAGKLSRNSTTEHDAQEEQYVIELWEISETFDSIEVANILHVARAQRAGELHIRRAKYSTKAKSATWKNANYGHSCATRGLKKVSRNISEQPAKPLIYVKRDRYTPDGGTQGQLTTGGNLESEVLRFFRTYASIIFTDCGYQLEDIDVDMVHET